MGTADEVWLPLDPRRLLILGHPDDLLGQRRIVGDPSTALTVNYAVAAGAFEQIYQHPSQDHLSGLDLPAPLPLMNMEGNLPLDMTRYTSPVATTRTQRRRRERP